MSGIIWLASYPKSGNTWLRLLLRALEVDGDAPELINAIDEGVIGSQREVFERVSGLVSSELLPDEAARLRPAVYRQLARASDRPLLLKIHDRFDSPAVGAVDFPVELTRAVVYIVRDPRDVCVSFAHHLGLSESEMQVRMIKDNLYLDGGPQPLPDQLPQWIGRWDGHAASWLDQSSCTPVLVRYEDLLADPLRVLGELLPQLGMVATEAQLQSAVERCRFERLSEAERLHGFTERPQQSVRFFRSGRSGDWAHRLDLEQITNIEKAFAPMMRRLGYADFASRQMQQFEG